MQRVRPALATTGSPLTARPHDIVEELTTAEVKLNIGGLVQDPNGPIGRLRSNALAMIAEFSVIWTRPRGGFHPEAIAA